MGNFKKKKEMGEKQVRRREGKARKAGFGNCVKMAVEPKKKYKLNLSKMMRMIKYYKLKSSKSS